VTPVSQLTSAWEAAPAVLAASALGLILFCQAFVRLRRRGRADHAGWGRAALFGAGLAVLTLALVSPLDAAGEEYLLSGHMLQHVLIGDAAPALMMAALRGPLLFFLLPGPALGALARLAPLRALVRALVRPRVSFTLWASVLAVWHVPSLYDFTLTHAAVHDLEHVCFVVSGLLVWFQLVDPARRGTPSRAGRLGLAVALFAAGQVLTMVLVFSFDPLYPAYAAQADRLWGLSPLTDQRLAGAVMMVEQAVTLGTCAAFLLLGAERDRRPGTAAPSLTPDPRP
jgi:putative membrane protein